MSSDATITLHAESGALEDRRHPMSFSPSAARESFGRILLRAHDRLRPDFADVPADVDLTLEETRHGTPTASAAWRASASRRTSSGGATTTATGSASPTVSMPRSTRSGTPTI